MRPGGGAPLRPGPGVAGLGRGRRGGRVRPASGAAVARDDLAHHRPQVARQARRSSARREPDVREHVVVELLADADAEHALEAAHAAADPREHARAVHPRAQPVAANRALEAPDRRRARPVALGRGGLARELAVAVRRRVPDRRPRGSRGALGALQSEVEGDAGRRGAGGHQQRDQRQGGYRPVPHMRNPNARRILVARTAARWQCRGVAVTDSVARGKEARKRSHAPAIASGPPRPTARLRATCWRHRTSRGCRSSCRSDTAACSPRRSPSSAARRRSWRPTWRTPESAARGAALRRRAPVELRRLRGAGPAPRLRRQRLRRDAAWPVRVGRQAPGGQPRGRGARAAARRGGAPSATLAALREYREAMRGFAGMSDLDVWYSRLDVDGVPGPREGERQEGEAEGAREGTGQGAQQGQQAGALEAERARRRTPRIVSDPP